MTVTRHLTIHGRVQGVGYRYAMVAVASRLGVTGWVRNRRDGTVEAVVQGSPDTVEEITNWAHQGPAASLVSQVEISESAEQKNYTDFTQQPTL
ncbi:MAG: acylphosphatase [Pseudomonadota bacterium]